MWEGSHGQVSKPQSPACPSALPPLTPLLHLPTHPAPSLPLCFRQVVLTNRGEPAASSVWKTLYARFWRLAHMPYLTSVEVPPALRQALHLLRFDETVEAARQAHLTEFNAWVFDADHPEVKGGEGQGWVCGGVGWGVG